MGGLGYFDTLGKAVDQAWTAAGRNEERFPDIAVRALRELEPPAALSATSILGAAIGLDRLPAQGSPAFGQPPITLYRARDFYVLALYWLDATTSIHQHAFSGAFRVLQGSSVHCEYAFDRRELVTRRLLLGALDFQGAELLRAGDVRAIAAGTAFIHSLFHLDRPTVTIVVRTVEEDVGTQFEYSPPGLAWDPFYRDDGLSRQLAALETLHGLSPSDAIRTAAELVDRADVWVGFQVVQHWLGRIGAGAPLLELVDRLAARHSVLGGTVEAAFGSLCHRRDLVLRRQFIHDPGHRLFFALLMNLPDRTSMLDVLRRAYPDQSPHQMLRTWLEDLSSPDLRGASGLRLEADVLGALLASLDDGGPESPSDLPSALTPLLH